MLDYDGAAFTLVDSQVVNAANGAFNHNVLLHNGYVIVYADNTIGNRQIVAYSVAGNNFTQVGSLNVHLDEPGQPGMWSDDEYLYLDIEGTGDKVSVYTFDGATFTEITSLADPSAQTNGVMGGNGRIAIRRTNGPTVIEMRDFDGATMSAVVRSLPASPNVAWAYDADTSLLFNVERMVYDLDE